MVEKTKTSTKKYIRLNIKINGKNKLNKESRIENQFYLE